MSVFLLFQPKFAKICLIIIRNMIVVLSKSYLCEIKVLTNNNNNNNKHNNVNLKLDLAPAACTTVLLYIILNSKVYFILSMQLQTRCTWRPCRRAGTSRRRTAEWRGRTRGWTDRSRRRGWSLCWSTPGRPARWGTGWSCGLQTHTEPVGSTSLTHHSTMGAVERLDNTLWLPPSGWLQHWLWTRPLCVIRLNTGQT